MVEPEVAFNDSDANMRLQEEFVSYIVGRTLERRDSELKELERDTAPLQRVTPPFPRISYTDAVARLNALGSDIKWGNDLGGDDETLLAREFDRPVFVYNYPKQVKAFARCSTTTAWHRKAMARSSVVPSGRTATTSY